MRFDLSQSTATALLEIHAWPAGDARRRLLAQLIAADREFTEWCHAQAGAAAEPSAANDKLAAWLDQHLLELPLVCDADAFEATPVLAALRELRGQLRELHALNGDFQRQLEEAKLAAMRELAYGASHEINNPLANIASRAQTLLKDEQDPEKRRKLAVINQQAFRAFEMIADLMLFAKPPAPNKLPVELGQVVDTVLGELGEEAARQETELVRGPTSEPIELDADRTQLEMAVRALCRNALEAVGSGGRVAIAVRRDGEWAEIVVTDTGPGIPPHVREHLFDPYYSGREAGRGLGLGLSKCWRIAELHSGRVVADEPETGAQFRLQLPINSGDGA